MPDTKNENMLGRLSGITEELEKVKNNISDMVGTEQIKVIEDTQEKITKLINELPKAIYNFKKNDYILCCERLQDIINSTNAIEIMIQNAMIGVVEIQTVGAIANIKEELIQCRNKATNKANDK